MASIKIVAVIFCTLLKLSFACEEIFEGFGVYLGSMNHFANSPPTAIPKVLEKLYSDLGIRHYRTSYESSFSPSRDTYEIKCNSSSICAYIDIHNEIAKYPNISVMASVWSPPHYMKNEVTQTLIVSEELNYYYFLKNITKLMQEQFNISIEKVSPVNEPENVFAPWEHTSMTPQQLCRMVHDFNDSLISVCPENSYFWISEAYSNTTDNTNVTCLEACEIFGTHSYALHIADDEDNLLAYYDQQKYDRKVPGMPIWQTEVSSTFGRSSERQMEEALDMAVNIVNFVGHTCIQRYYFWLSYTLGSSGESLIWGSDTGDLRLPKKYFAYKHFTQASFGGEKRVVFCGKENLPEVHCLKFGDNHAVFVNPLPNRVPDWNETISCDAGSFCCTSESSDWDCSGTFYELPQESICSCKF